MYLSVCLSVYLSIYLQDQKRRKSATLPKRSKSARLRKCLNLTASKTKQFCETSFKNGKLNAELMASYQSVLRLFHTICLKYCACHEKVMPSQTKCCTCHAESSSQTWRSDAPKCNLSQEISGLPSFLEMLRFSLEPICCPRARPGSAHPLPSPSMVS